MARTQSRTSTAIWSDVDFRNLSESSQRVYWMLYSQPTISLCGVLALTVKRWASNAKDSTEEGILRALKELEMSGHIIVDYDTEEVLVRTFAKHDGVQKNSKTWGPTWHQLDNISSPAIRQSAEAELWEIGHPPDGFPDRDTPYPSGNGNGSEPGNGASSLCPPVPSLRPRPPSTSLPGEPPDSGTGATHRTEGRDLASLSSLVQDMTAVCKGDNRRAVHQEASEVVAWAVAAVDPRLIEEAIGWARSLQDPPTLPRAIASTIMGKARDSNIPLHPFKPSRRSA